MPGDPPQAPLTIGLAITGLHVIHIVEYCRAHDLPLDHLLAREAPASPRTLQWIRTTCRALDAPEPVVGAFVVDAGVDTTAADFELVAALLEGQGDRRLRIVSGGFHLPFLWFLVERYADRIDSVVVVDEGIGTYASEIGDRNAVPEIVSRLQEPALESAFAAFSQFSVTLYSRFPLTTQLREGDTLEHADPAVLATLLRFDASPPAPCVYFVGSPLHLVLADAGIDTVLTSLALHVTKRLHPGTEVVYVPHRDELPAKLEALTALVEVRPLDHPIELEALMSGVAPRRLATFASSAALSCGMVDPAIAVDVFGVPDRFLQPSHVDAYRVGQALFTELLGSQGTMHDLDAGVAAAGLPAGLLDRHLGTPGSAVAPMRVDPSLPVADVVAVLGSDAEASLLPAESALAQARALLAFARQVAPGSEVVYVPSHAESPAKRAALAEVAPVEHRDLPAELLPAEWGYRPRHVVTVRSAALGALTSGAHGEVTGWVLRPAADGYELEQAAVEAAHRDFRAIADADLRWEALLPEEPYDAAEELVLAQRRHSRDALVLRERVAELEAELAAERAESTRRHVRIGELHRVIRSHASVIDRLRERRDSLIKRNRRLKAEIAALRERLAAAEQEAARRTGLRGLVGRGRPGSKDLG